LQVTVIVETAQPAKEVVKLPLPRSVNVQSLGTMPLMAKRRWLRARCLD